MENARRVASVHDRHALLRHLKRRLEKEVSEKGEIGNSLPDTLPPPLPRIYYSLTYPFVFTRETHLRSEA